jgi:hypothetical protein
MIVIETVGACPVEEKTGCDPSLDLDGEQLLETKLAVIAIRVFDLGS